MSERFFESWVQILKISMDLCEPQDEISVDEHPPVNVKKMVIF